MNKSLSSLWWAVKFQFRMSPGFSALSFVHSIYDGAQTIIYAYAVAQLITEVTAVAFAGIDPGGVYRWLAAIAGLEIVRTIARNLNTLVDRKLEMQLDVANTKRFITKLYDLSQEQFDNQEFITILNRARESIQQIYRVLYELNWAASSIVRLSTSILAIVFVSPLVGLIIALSIVPTVFLKSRQNKRTEATYKEVEPYERIAHRSRWMLFDPNYMPEVRLVNGFKRMLSSWENELTKSHNAIFKNDRRVALIDSVTGILSPLTIFVATVHFFRRLIDNTIGLDQFIFLRGVLEQANGAASAVATSTTRLHELSIYLSNYRTVQQTQPAIANGTKHIDDSLTIEFKDVSFAYPGTDELVLKNISFMIFPGSKLALVGENGAGKSTLLKLLLRQYLPTSGEIIINGHPIEDLDSEGYYKHISNLSQDFLIVNHLTIKDNLTLGLSKSPSDSKIRHALEQVEANGFIDKLPNKINQRLDTSFEDGSSLSGGQLQRVGVARALLRNGDMLILDEPTSAVDAKAEYNIFNNIYKEHGDRTTLIVSHRFSTVRKADKIIVMENGEITEYGSHKELLDYGKLYKEMFEAQAEGYR